MNPSGPICVDEEATCRPRRARILDAVVLVALPLLFAWPLFSEQARLPTTASIVALLAAGVAFSWNFLVPSLREERDAAGPLLRPLLWRGLLLFLFAVPGFYLALERQFWAGCNEGFLIGHAHQDVWSDFLDRFSGRPLAELGVHLAFALSPRTLDGFLWLALALRVVTGLLAGEVLAEGVPLAWRGPVACATGLLFISNPSEPSRFLAIGMVVYHVPVFAFALACWLYLKSYALGLRSLLALSGAALLLSALCYESVLPIAFFVPLLILLARTRPWRATWIAYWFLCWGLVSLRFAIHILHPATYQGYLASATIAPQLFSNLLALLEPSLAFLRCLPGPAPGSLGLASFVLAFLAVWRESDAVAAAPESRGLVRGVLVACLAILLGVAPYIVLPMGILKRAILSFATLRTQYYAAPGQAALYAVGLALLASRLPSRSRRLFFAAATALVVAIASEAALDAQSRPLRDQPGGAFFGGGLDEVARIFREVDRLDPKRDLRSGVFFVLPPGTRTPFGPDYDLLALSCARLGVPAWAGSYIRGRGFVPKVNFGSPEPEEVYGFSGTLAAFKLLPNGEVRPFAPRVEAAVPARMVDLSVACESWTLPKVLFGAEAAPGGASPFDLGREDFLRVSGR